MNHGLLAKTWRESWPITLLLGLALMVVEMVLVYALSSFREQISLVWMSLPFFQHMLRGLLGAEVGGHVGPEMLISIAWVHPVVLTLVWANAIASCTRVPAGEVDRGTIDLLLGLPVSRWQVYATTTLVWLVFGVLLALMVAGGHGLGALLLGGRLEIDRHQLAMLSVNLMCLYVVVGGLACLASALSDRRGRSIGAVIALLLASFLLNYLAQFWKPAERLSFLSILHYYRPLAILHDAPWPASDMAVLLGCGFVLWLAGGVVFARRDLATL